MPRPKPKPSPCQSPEHKGSPLMPSLIKGKCRTCDNRDRMRAARTKAPRVPLEKLMPKPRVPPEPGPCPRPDHQGPPMPATRRGGKSCVRCVGRDWDQANRSTAVGGRQPDRPQVSNQVLRAASLAQLGAEIGRRIAGEWDGGRWFRQALLLTGTTALSKEKPQAEES
jgi:hypothetical protein